VEVARHHVHATKHLFVVTHPIAIGIGFTASATYAQGILLVALTIAIAQRQEITAALVHRAWTIANATFVQVSKAGVNVVANAIHVQIQGAFSPAHPNFVELVAVAIAIALGNGVTTAFVDRARTVAHTAFVQHADAVVFIVAYAVSIFIRQTAPPADAQGIKLVAVAVAVAFRDVGATAHEDGPFTTAHATFVQLVAVAVAIAFRNRHASALVDVSGTVAYATCVDLAYAVVHVVAHPVTIHVCRAIAATHAQSVQLVAVAIAIPCSNVLTVAFIDIPRAVAHATRVVRTHAVVHVVAHLVAVRVSRALTTAHVKGIEVQAGTVVQRGAFVIARILVSTT
jgi:hypothetical protein